MRALIQRVTHAHVSVDGVTVGDIEHGLLVLLGVGQGDTDSDAVWLSEKILKLRIFSDDTGRMNRSIREVNGGMLVVSQFTLYADVRKGTRPSFVDAADPIVGQQLYERFCTLLREANVAVATGIFGGNMQVTLTNDGPATLLIDSQSNA